MQKAVNSCVFLSVSFMFLLAIVPYLAEENTTLFVFLYAATFLIPIAAYFALEKKMGLYGARGALIAGKARISLSLALIFPTVILTATIAYLASIAFSSVGLEGTTVVRGSDTYILFVYVIIPAFGEELLFRLAPMRALLRYSPRAAIITSATLFAAVHANLFQIPYALFAGAAYAFLFAVSGSILPCIGAHLINNSLSAMTIFYRESIFTDIAIFASLLLIAISVVVLIIKRRHLFDAVRGASVGSKDVFTPSHVAFLVFALLLAVLAAI